MAAAVGPTYGPLDTPHLSHGGRCGCGPGAESEAQRCRHPAHPLASAPSTLTFLSPWVVEWECEGAGGGACALHPHTPTHHHPCDATDGKVGLVQVVSLSLATLSSRGEGRGATEWRPLCGSPRPSPHERGECAPENPSRLSIVGEWSGYEGA